MKQSTDTVLVLPDLIDGWALQRNNVSGRHESSLDFTGHTAKSQDRGVKLYSPKNLEAKLVLITLTYFRHLCKIN